MSDLDDELEDLEPSSSVATDDGFDDPRQTTTALTMEINKLRQKNELLRQFNVRQKDKYKHEVRSFLEPVLDKYKDVKGENEFLRGQIKELSQKIASSPLLVKTTNQETGEDNSDVATLQNAYNEKEKEVAVLNRMVKNMEEEVHNAKKNVAEIPALRDLLKQKEEQIKKVEQEKFDLNSRVEAKDKSVDKYLKQINELETNLYVLNKRVAEGGAVASASAVASTMDSAKVQEYEDKLRKANEKASNLEDRVNELQRMVSEYEESMNSLEQELHDEDFVNGNGLAHHEDAPVSKALEVEDELHAYDFDGELPSDEDLLADDIELDELPLGDDIFSQPVVEKPKTIEKSTINFAKPAEVVAPAPVASPDDELLDGFELSMDSMDEDRDTLGKK